MVGWHHQLNGHRLGWTPGVGDGQADLTCCGSWGHTESDTTDVTWQQQQRSLKKLEIKLENQRYQRNFSYKDGHNKGQKLYDLTEAEDIKKRWQEYTEELYKKDHHDSDNPDGVITHLEPDILECEVKWALGNITMNKASGGDRIPAELFQILKMMLLKCGT